MKKEIKFLSNKYIVIACTKWFNMPITFNEADSILKRFNDWRLVNGNFQVSQEQMFEDFLFDLKAQGGLIRQDD